jgi:hypothetical protein
MEFCVGFHIRVAPAKRITTDWSVWREDQVAVQSLKDLGEFENRLQLFDCDTDLIEELCSQQNIGLALTADRYTLGVLKSHHGLDFARVICKSESLVKRGWRFCGYDVSDIRSLYSYLDMRASMLNSEPLAFTARKPAQGLVDEATNTVPEHSPFGVFGMYTYRKSLVSG